MANTITLTNGNDSETGTILDDIIWSLDGDDTVFGGIGSDTIHGGNGSDELWGEADNDTIYGDNDNDKIDGGDGNDSLNAGKGDDAVDGGAGDDSIYAGEGSDTVYGGIGNDTLLGGSGLDDLHGGAGDDYIEGGSHLDHLYGDAGNDRIFGDDGDDMIVGGTGSDMLYGGAGDDTFVGMDGDGNDIVYGGAGSDTLDLSAMTEAMDIRLGNVGTERGSVKTATQSDTIWSIENVIGGSGDDRIFASEAVNVLDGGDGNDTFVFETASGANGTTILGFSAGDVLCFRDIDADSSTEGHDAFTLAGRDANTGAGQLTYSHGAEDGENFTTVTGMTDQGDFQLKLSGHITLEEDNFLLA